jgi:hypothetical protein
MTDVLDFEYFEYDLFASMEDRITISGTSKDLNILAHPGDPTCAMIMPIKPTHFRKSI